MMGEVEMIVMTGMIDIHSRMTRLSRHPEITRICPSAANKRSGELGKT